MNFQNHTFTPATASARVRTLWQTFEKSQVKDRLQLDVTVNVALAKADAAWNKAPTNTRMSRIAHNATKAQIAKAIKATYFEKARAKWQEKLEGFGLKVEFWTDLTEDEKKRITNTLGADDESDEDVMVAPELPPAPIAQPTQTSFFQPLAPSFSTSSRATNLSSSSYAFVNPSEFNSEEEDFELDVPFSNPVATSVDLTSEDDDDAVFSVPRYSVPRPSVVGSGFSRASFLQNPVSDPPKPLSARPLASDFVYNTATSRTAPTKRSPQVSQNEDKSATIKAKIPRQPYVGPSLDTADEPIDEELEFEKFKMRTRMEKIVEFHEAAALAEITLSIEIYKARKQLNNSKEEDAPRVLEHQKRMVQLQKEKEEERKAIVKSERARRQSDLGRPSKRGATKELPMSSDAFKAWGLSSFQEEMPLDLSSRFNLDTLLSEDPAKQQRNVESLLSEMFADDSQPYAGPEVSASNLFNSYSSASSNQDAFRGSASIHDTQEQLRPSHPSMSWNKPQSNPSPKPPRKTHLSPFGESSDEEDNAPAVVGISNENIGWDIDKPNAKSTVSMWNNKDVRTTPVSSAWSTKKATASTIPPRHGSSILSNPNSSLATAEIGPEPTATPVMSSKAAKGKKADKSSVSPPAVETAIPSNKAPVAETPAVPPKVEKQAPTPAPAPTPIGKKQNKKQRQANNKKGAVAAPTAVAESVIPEQEPETELIPPPRESPKPEAPAPAPEPVIQGSEHTWLPKMVPAVARARIDSGSTIPSINWDEVASTPRPAPKIPTHLQEMVKSEGTPRPSMLKRQNLMAEGSSATSSRTTLEQMPPTPIAVGAYAPTPGPSLWGKTKADFETAKVAQQPAVNDFWVPGSFDGADNYNDEGNAGSGSGGGDENVGQALWESTATLSKQIGKAAPIPVKQQQAPVAVQRLRRVSEATSSPAPRVLGTKTDIGQPAPPTVNSNSKKARGKKNVKGKQRATIEDVSDEEKDNIDILSPESTFIMESKVILEPKPSVPPVVYNPIIDFTDNGVNDNEHSSSPFRPTMSTTSSLSPDEFFGSEPRFSNAFKTQGTSTPIGADWSAIGKHARWTPAVNHDREASSVEPSFPAAFGSRLQAKPSVQQTPIWGQPNPSARDKGKGK